MGEKLEVMVDLTNDKVQFTGKVRDNHAIVVDYKPPVGDGEGYTSLELLLFSLATCTGTSIISLLRKMRKSVAGFKVIANGIRRDTHPTSFTKIFLEFVLSSNDTGEPDLQKAIKISEESFCPVWAMLKNNVEISYEYKIICPDK
jgi:putative redox protein